MNEVERAPVQTLADHCAELQATAGVAARSRLVRVYEELKLAAHVGQARALAALEVREAADFGPRARVGPGVGRLGRSGRRGRTR